MTVLVVAEHDRGVLAPATLQAITFARTISATVHAVTIGAAADGLAPVLGRHGVSVVVQAHHDLLFDYGPETWGATVAQVVGRLSPRAVLAAGSDKGNEVMAHAAAMLDVPMVANCADVSPGEPWNMIRMRWGGSLLEQCTLGSGPALLTVAHHGIEASEAPGTFTTEAMEPVLDNSLARTIVVERGERVAGVSLATSPVVVGGGRGVGSAEGFVPLEELAELLGGVVGCSRAVTNNGWRSHSDQVGQTGTRIAPDLYLACGISGAIQHWVGAMASRKILAINTDPEANMVARADYAVIGDLHEVVPAITLEIQRRLADHD